MSPASRYQVVLLEPGGGGRNRRLEDTLRVRVGELGLDPKTSITFLDERTVASVDRRAPIVGVYFGGKTQLTETTTAVEELRKLSAFVLPVVPTLKQYTRQVPASLHEINGFAPDAGDAALESVAARLLEELNLLRERRRVFISYRRDKTRRAAEQLYHALDARSFNVFLDTHSVLSGTFFQSVLWDRMSDADLLILLDAPGTLDSRWVTEEIARAHQLGLGVLQLVWPGHTRAPETLFCVAEYLEGADFLRGDAGRKGGLSLRERAIERLLMATEGLRARSMAARRSRLVNELCNHAGLAGLSTAIQPARHIDVKAPKGRSVRVFPVVGHPDSVVAHEVFDACHKAPVDGVLLYDPAGMQPRRARHLEWLNEHLPRSVRMLRTTEIGTWARAL